MKQLFLNPQRFTVCFHVDVLESDDGALSGRVTRSQVDKLGFIPSSQRVSVSPCLQPEPKVTANRTSADYEGDELRLSKC